MTDLPERPDLLPPHDDRPVPAALVAVDGRLDDLNMSEIVEVKSAANAGVGFLPYLAWETSVDVWDAWPEATKRAVIQAAPIVHRYKGTRYAVATALGALGVTSEIVEWWQATPRAAPYTFRVTAYAHARLYDGPILDARLIKVVHAAIIAAKPASRAFALSIAAVMADRPGLAPALTARGRVPATLSPINRDDFKAAYGLAPVAAARATIPASLKPASDETLASPVGLAPIAALRARVPVAMRPRSSDGLASRPGIAPAAVARVRLYLSMRASA